MKEFTSVIKTLLNLQSQISLTVETLNEIGNNYKVLKAIKLENYHHEGVSLESASHTLISNHAIILFCSFLDEYNKFFNISHLKNVDPEKITNVKRKNEPGLKRIKEWKDLKKFRNYLIAHNFRIKGKSFFSEEFDMFEFKIPNKVSEKNLFSGIVYFICLNIRNEFPEIFSTLNDKEIMLDKIKFISEEVDNEKELIELFHEMKI